MNWARERRLDRQVKRATWAETAEAERRAELRAHAKIGAWVRRVLQMAGIDPAAAVSLRGADEAAAELAALGESLEQPCDERPPGKHRLQLDDKMARLVRRYRDGFSPDPDLAHDSLASLFAWCIASLDPDGERIPAPPPTPQLPTTSR